jgi:hypothetical protein
MGVKTLKAIFQHKVFRMHVAKGKIAKEMIWMLSSMRHSGFDMFYVNRIRPKDEMTIKNLARYIILASFSQETMTYVPESSTVVYASKDGKTSKIFPAQECFATMCSYIPKYLNGSIWL